MLEQREQEHRHAGAPPDAPGEPPPPAALDEWDGSLTNLEASAALLTTGASRGAAFAQLDALASEVVSDAPQTSRGLYALVRSLLCELSEAVAEHAALRPRPPPQPEPRPQPPEPPPPAHPSPRRRRNESPPPEPWPWLRQMHPQPPPAATVASTSAGRTHLVLCWVALMGRSDGSLWVTIRVTIRSP